LQGWAEGASRNLLANAVFLELAVEGGFADAEQARGHELVAIELGDGGDDGLLLEVGDGLDGVGLGGGGEDIAGGGCCLVELLQGLLGVELVVLHLGGEVAEMEDGAAGERAGALDGALEFADIAGPIVLHEQVQGFIGEGVGDALFGFHAFEDVGGEQRDIAAPLAQGGDAEGDDVEAEVEVFAEVAGLDEVGEVAGGGGEDAGGQRNALIGADGEDDFILEGAEEAALEIEGELADFVEEDGLAFEAGEQANLGARGSGDGTLGVAEEFSFDHGGGEGAAVDGKEGLVGVGSVGVDGTGDEFFAGAGLADDEDRMGGGGDLGEDAIELLHGGRVADQVAHRSASAELVAEQAGFDIERATLGGAIESGGELFEGEGLGKIVAGAGAHGLYCRVDGGEGGHDDDDGLRVVGVDVFEEREAAAAGKLEVEQKDIDGTVLKGETCSGDGVRGLGGEAEAGGDFGTGVADGGIVVDDQNAEGRLAIGVGAASGPGRGVVLGPGDGGGCWGQLAGGWKRQDGIGREEFGAEHVMILGGAWG